MRIGSNPEKFNNKIDSVSYHRVIIPVYIPSSQGYFNEALEIFKLNLESLLLTVHERTRITIYNNNSSPEVKEYIDKMYSEHIILDQVFHSKENLGKINAILAAAKGNLEPLITISDSDVLFKHDWQNQVEDLFLSFTGAGMVSPVPNSTAYNAFTANNWFIGIFGKGKIKFEEVNDPQAMKKFEHSLGDKVRLFSPANLQKYLVLNLNGERAVMGSGHFIATLRREIIDYGSNTPAFIKIQGGVENKFLDIPNEELGYLRLSTLGNYAFHMGNKKEDWMLKEFESLKARGANNPFEKNFPSPLPLNKWQKITGKAIRRLLLSNYLKKIYFKKIGLGKHEKY